MMEMRKREGPRGRTGSPFDAAKLKSWEWWLNKIGITLLLLGVAFLFKLAYDKDWLAPPLRVGFGLALGCALLGLGLRVYERRRSFAQVFLGGGVGVLYTTGFAAFGFFGLVPYPVAFAFMVAVTLLAFGLSLRQDDVSLSVIGASGGLGTPFILYSAAGDLGGLVLYTCVVLLGMCAVYLYKGWRSLLYVSFVGGWAVFLAGYWGDVFGKDVPFVDRAALAAGVAFAWLLFWLVPLAREVLHLRSPRRWPKPGASPLLRESPVARAIIGEPGSARAEAWRTSVAHVHLLSVSTPLLVLAFERRILTLPADTLGLISLALAAAYALATVALRRVEGGHGRLHYTQGLMALLLGTLGLVLFLSGHALFFALAAEAALLHLVARRIGDRLISAQAHLLSAAAVSWLFFRVFSDLRETAIAADPAYLPFLNGGSLVDLSVVALLFGASRAVLPAFLGEPYRLVAHAALFAWLSTELLALPNGDDAVLLVWALYATVLHFYSGRYGDRRAEVAAHALSVAVGVWLAGRLVPECALLFLPGIGAEAFDAGDLANLAVVSLAFALSRIAVPATSAYYLAFGHAALLGWLSAVLGALPGGGDLVFLAWTAYALGLHLASKRGASRVTALAAHAASACVAAALAVRLGLGLLDPAVVLGAGSVADLAAIAAAVWVSRLRPVAREASYYRLAAAGAFSLGLARELLPLGGGDDLLLVAWSGYGVALCLLARRFGDGLLGNSSHLQFLVVGVMLLERLVTGFADPGSVGTPVFGADALADLASISLAALVSIGLRPDGLRFTYLVSVHAAFLVFLWRELHVLPGGDAYVTVAWGLYAAGLLVAGLRLDRTVLVRGGLATLFFVVGKLFLVDLSEVEPVWRVVLFLGFGGLFLALSYYLQGLWRPGSGDSQSRPSGTVGDRP